MAKYITLIKHTNKNWELGFGATDSMENYEKFKADMIECLNVEDVKIMVNRNNFYYN